MMKNPYKFLREKCGLTQKRFCDEYGFAKQTLISIEQGVYEDLSNRMQTAIEAACHDAGVSVEDELVNEYGAASLPIAYNLYRIYERESFVVDTLPRAGTAELSPMHFLVKETTGSVQGFAKKIKVQTAILLSYITGKQKDMPYPLQEALRDTGYAHTEELVRLQNDWIKHNV
jgi:DNA-binding XRE family transcriptional regulator